MDYKQLKNGVFGGSIVLLIMINVFNALNYFFHFAMARFLSAADYGILAVLMSIIFIFNISNESIQTIISKYAAGEKDEGKLKNITKRALKKVLGMAIFLFFIYLVIAIFLMFILKISYALLAFTGLILICTFLIPVTRGVIQGKRKFNILGFNMIFEGTVKIILSILFVLFGFRVYGAIGGVIIGSISAFLLSFVPLKSILKTKEKTGTTEVIYQTSLPIIVSIIAIMAFLSLDVIVARAVFPAETVGYYAMASMMAKVIFFGTFPISKAMFPISAQHEKNDKEASKILNQSLIILGFCIVIALIIFYLFSDWIIRIFAGRFIPEAADILIFVAIAISLLSFTNLILLHKISVGKTKNYWLLFIFIIVEIALFYFFNDNLLEYSVSFVTASAIFLWSSIILLNK
jgi:O-antigen/teichoic acid export membrane protein